MGLAKYFGKDVLAINQLLSTSFEVLDVMLSKVVVTIAYDTNAVTTKEGLYGLDLLIRLCARFYPNLSVKHLSGQDAAKVESFHALARGINANISILDEDKTGAGVCIVAGATEKNPGNFGQVFYFGSNGWTLRFSPRQAQPFEDSQNPFGAGAAACVAASNAFRYVFRESLPNVLLDEDLELSVLGLIDHTVSNEPDLNSPIRSEDITLVGVGAIGNGVVWALSKIPGLAGSIDLVDPEAVTLSNLQRYVLTDEATLGGAKAELAGRSFAPDGVKLIRPYKMRWSEYVREVGIDKLRCIVVAVDSANDRIGIQSSLPKTIFNGFTEAETIGLSRHLDFENGACLACSYIPMNKQKDYIVRVAESLRIPSGPDLIKHYLNLNIPVDDRLLQKVSQANGIDIARIQHFAGKTVPEFYSDFICGGIILTVARDQPQLTKIEAPLAFQSTLAGVLLAANVTLYLSGHISTDTSLRTDIYPLQPLGKAVNPFQYTLEKDKSSRCLCCDDDFRARYHEKWAAT